MITRSEYLTIAAILRNSRPAADRQEELIDQWHNIRENLIPFLQLHCAKFDIYEFRMLTESRTYHNDPMFIRPNREVVDEEK